MINIHSQSSEVLINLATWSSSIKLTKLNHSLQDNVVMVLGGTFQTTIIVYEVIVHKNVYVDIHLIDYKINHITYREKILSIT